MFANLPETSIDQRVCVMKSDSILNKLFDKQI